MGDRCDPLDIGDVIVIGSGLSQRDTCNGTRQYCPPSSGALDPTRGESGARGPLSIRCRQPGSGAGSASPVRRRQALDAGRPARRSFLDAIRGQPGFLRTRTPRTMPSMHPARVVTELQGHSPTTRFVCRFGAAPRPGSSSIGISGRGTTSPDQSRPDGWWDPA